MTDTTAFLHRVFGEYFRPDVHNLLNVPADAANRGACLYPLAMTLVSGIELAGALLTPGGYDTSGEAGKGYFLRYWEHMYGKPAVPVGADVYAALRNPVAHIFLSRLPLCRRESPGLFVPEDGIESLNLRVLAADFETKCTEDFLGDGPLWPTVEPKVKAIIRLHQPKALRLPERVLDLSQRLTDVSSKVVSAAWPSLREM